VIEIIVKGISDVRKKLFYIDCEEKKEEDLEQLLDTEETTPTITFHALA